jgi:hypothetical protein
MMWREERSSPVRGQTSHSPGGRPFCHFTAEVTNSSGSTAFDGPSSSLSREVASS